MTAAAHFDGVPVAPWLVPRLKFARANGWRGRVVSGYRTDAEQLREATAYARRLGRPIASVYPSGVYASNHCGLRHPKGAVDVTDAQGLDLAMALWSRRGKVRRLVWAGPTIGDWVHFSANGH